jgi:hypothetical protein
MGGIVEVRNPGIFADKRHRCAIHLSVCTGATRDQHVPDMRRVGTSLGRTVTRYPGSTVQIAHR